ncbi:hydrogenase maturation protease [Thermovibrio guaymasensis]|uniref:Hydrogenase maturation protease n=1 Tax=Thermovibrio guaymasensis TaxID=240167 RepID=A0A420W6W7_9BACT|nr:hydrogenase maturation protease [Thermovibrio guaymasensis]RKQ61767.1 hydrogenase maturation protease [Thermovibrio guaymasensis]
MKAIVIGVGNPSFGDDGAGAEVVKELKGKVATCHLLSPSLEILERVKGYDLAVLVDAVDVGLKPGEIVEFSVEKGRNRERFGGLTHSLSMEEVITTGYELFPETMPKKVIFIGIQVKEMSPFKGKLSSEVKKAVKKVKERVEELLNL